MICPLAWAALSFKWVPQKIHNGRSNNLYKALVTLSGKHPDTDFVGSLPIVMPDLIRHPGVIEFTGLAQSFTKVSGLRRNDGKEENLTFCDFIKPYNRGSSARDNVLSKGLRELATSPQIFFNSQQLIIFGNTIGARGGSRLNLSRIDGHR